LLFTCQNGLPFVPLPKFASLLRLARVEPFLEPITEVRRLCNSSYAYAIRATDHAFFFTSSFLPRTLRLFRKRAQVWDPAHAARSEVRPRRDHAPEAHEDAGMHIQREPLTIH